MYFTTWLVWWILLELQNRKTILCWRIFINYIQDKKRCYFQWRIQDFPQGGAPTPKSAIIFQFFAENCMKMKEFGPLGGARVPGAPLGSANDFCPTNQRHDYTKCYRCDITGSGFVTTRIPLMMLIEHKVDWWRSVYVPRNTVRCTFCFLYRLFSRYHVLCT